MVRWLFGYFCYVVILLLWLFASSVLRFFGYAVMWIVGRSVFSMWLCGSSVIWCCGYLGLECYVGSLVVLLFSFSGYSVLWFSGSSDPRFLGAPVSVLWLCGSAVFSLCCLDKWLVG